eukprot:10365288-Alexandrium_andersonii.AAC.1
MTKPELAGDGLGLELWRVLVRGHEAPAQPVVLRAFRERWAYPGRRKDASEFRARLPEWGARGREREDARGR